MITGLPGGVYAKVAASADGTRMAGPGQMIYWVASREAALTLDPWFVPVDDAIVGLVDEVLNYSQDEAGDQS